MSVRRSIGRVIQAAGLGLAVLGVALMGDEEREEPERDEDSDDDVHVMPTYGREHTDSVRCWCGPTRHEDEPLVVVHRDIN